MSHKPGQMRKLRDLHPGCVDPNCLPNRVSLASAQNFGPSVQGGRGVHFCLHQSALWSTAIAMVFDLAPGAEGR